MKKQYLIVIIFFSIQCFSQNKRIDSLKEKLSVAKEDTNKVWILHALSIDYAWSFADSAIMYVQQGLKLSQQLNFERGEAYCMAALSLGFTTLGNYTASLNWGFKSLSLFKKLNDPDGINYAYGALGMCYREQGDYKKSLFYWYESSRIGAQRILDENLADVYQRNNQQDSALYYAKRAIKNIGVQSGLLLVFGAIHTKLAHYELALDYYRRAIPLALQSNTQTDILNAYNGIAQVFLDEGKADSAIYYAKQTLIQKWGMVYPIGLLHASMMLADIYESRNMRDSTLKFLKLTINLKDSLFNEQKTREAQSFDFNEQLQQQEQAAKQLQNASTLKIYGLFGVAGAILIIAYFLYRNNRQKQKANILLSQQKQKVEETLIELKSTQSQLIQSEKMASLGQLTAGIAHEIQNPLNFVNNFSEVSNELIDEMTEDLNKRDIDEAIIIARDLKQNLEKINHHGKRADAIVRGMLQHSQTSIGQKESTDINKLAEEYLRLSHHGFRAKNNPFSATMKTDIDETIGKINIIPRDIGKVLLNLYNNAFYTVNEKSKSGIENYEPTISVSTKKINNKIEIRVGDNGNGIPQKVVDKIFQPFFTTKPTGQGTGLGLSLSYDIVKAHGGELRVETNEGEGTEFIIQIPA